MPAEDHRIVAKEWLAADLSRLIATPGRATGGIENWRTRHAGRLAMGIAERCHGDMDRILEVRDADFWWARRRADA